MSRAVTAARGVLTALAFTSAALVLSVLPGVGELPERSRLDHRSTEVVDRHGRPLSESLSARDTRNRPVALSDVSPHIASALLAVEDRRFYAHGGIDPLATARAAWSNLVELRVVSGGSTLTQQLARLLSADAAVAAGRPVPERTAVQKLREAHLALRLEQSFDKHEILELFLNRAPFGHSAVGVEAAARRYFDTSARTLSVEQSAWLIALIRGPSFYDPFEHRVRLERRMRSVLSAMHTKGFLTDSQVERAKATPVIPHRYAIPGESIHARGLARREWRAKGGGALPERLALTVDARLEERIRAIVRDEAPKIYRRGARSSAVVVLDHHQGEVLAAVGSTFEENPHWGEFSAVTALRQPGSALKPFLYAAALERGETAASLAADIEKPFPDTWGIYKPKNYDELYHGPVRYRAALAQSLNVAAVDVLADVGLEGFFSTLERFGFRTLERRPAHYGLGLTLGSAPVHLIDLTNAYAALARAGEWQPWTVLRSSSLGDPEPGRRVISREVAFILGDILSDSNARAEQFGLRSVLSTPYWAAAKTGTSKGYRDNWTVGFSKDWTVGVWVGDPTGKPMHHISGVEGAGTIWRRVMDHLTGGRSAAPKPPEALEKVRICSVSGHRVGPHCEGGLHEWFVEGTAPAHSCEYHRQVRVDPRDDGLVPEECRVPDAEPKVATIYPSPYDAWATSLGVGRTERVSARCTPKHSATARVSLSSPAPREHLSLDPDVPLEFQALTLRATVEGSTAALSFFIDGMRVAEVTPPYEWIWPLTPGDHTIEAKLADGTRSETHHVSVR